MPLSKITAHDVAKRAGVSQPTVSRVFTKGTTVSDDLALRVRKAAQELGYRPNTLARSLTTGQSKTIGLVVAYLDNPFYAEALEALSRGFKLNGYHILVLMAANRTDEIDAVVEDLLDHQVDGIILASVSISNALTQRLADAGMPLILFNRRQDDPRVSSVTSANYQGGRLAARFLIAGGHRRLAHISGWQGSSTGRDRQSGFIDALREADLKPLVCIDSRFQRDKAISAVHTLFSSQDTPDAIFAGNDHVAFAVLETLRNDLDITVPQEVSVIGYDDVAMAAWPTFNLTTIKQPVSDMTRVTINLLLDMIDRQICAPPQHIELPCALRIRTSARVPTQWSMPGEL